MLPGAVMGDDDDGGDNENEGAAAGETGIPPVAGTWVRMYGGSLCSRLWLALLFLELTRTPTSRARPPLGGSSVAAKEGSKINDERLRFFGLLMFTTFILGRSDIMLEVAALYFKKTGKTGLGEECLFEAVAWACGVSPVFEYK